MPSAARRPPWAWLLTCWFAMSAKGLPAHAFTAMGAASPQTVGPYFGDDGYKYTAYIVNDGTERYADGRRTFALALAFCASVQATLSPYDSPAVGDSVNAIKTLCTARYDTCWLNQPTSNGDCPLLAADGTLQIQGCEQVLSFVCRAPRFNVSTTQPPPPPPRLAVPPPAQPSPRPRPPTVRSPSPQLQVQSPVAPTPAYTAAPSPTASPSVRRISPQYKSPTTPVLSPASMSGLPPPVVTYTPLVLDTPTSPPSALLSRYTNTYSACGGATCYFNPQQQMLPPDWAQPPPTNWWWSGWTHRQEASNIPQQGVGTFANQLHPWGVQLLPTGVVIAPPKPLQVTPNYIMAPFDTTLTITAADVPFTSKRFIAANELGGTVRWTRDDAAGSMTSTLLQGMAMMTLVFDSATPHITFGQAIISPAPGSYTQASLMLDLSNGIKYKLYFSHSVTLTVSGTTLQLAAPLTGVMRIAILANSNVPSMAYSSAIEAIYDANSDIYPTSATLDLGYTGSYPTRKGIARIFFSTASMCKSNKGQLMMMALPHHRRLLVSPPKPADTVVRMLDLRGELIHVLGNDWYLEYPLSTITWHAPAGISDADKRQAVVAAVLSDATSWAGLTPRDDAYFGGSDMAAMGRIALIADELSQTADASTAPQLRAAAAGLRSRLKAALASVLVTNPGKNSSLVYDTTWGGVTTYRSLQYHDNADFGSAQYNDHHFHWGYWLYAAAAVGKHEPGWLRANKDLLLTLVRDFANPRRDDPFFPFARYKDPWAGHSWASGTTIFADSKNQESSSEAVNGYYALSLLGEALDDNSLKIYGQLLTAMEVQSAQEYWHIPSSSSNYPAPFAANAVVGMLWCSKADYGTWFGNLPVFMHGIQWEPFTPMTENLLSKAWIQQSYAVAQAGGLPAAPGDAGWSAFLIMAQAINDQDSAWTRAMALDPNSFYGAYASHPRSAVLYWIATRPA